MIKKLTKRDIPKVKKVFEFDENLEIYLKEQPTVPTYLNNSKQSY